VCTSFFIHVRKPGVVHKPSAIAMVKHNYPFSKKYYETYLKRLNSKNITIQTDEIMGNEDIYKVDDDTAPLRNGTFAPIPGISIIITNKNSMSDPFADFYNTETHDDPNEPEDDYFNQKRTRKKKSENFEVITKSPYNFKNIGGYDSIKKELDQCVDILKNHTKYARFNVRIPKGIIFEGPPGNGKTLLAKSLAGEAGCGFIAVSGSEFQEKYVGVGASRIREMFQLAKKNIPCIIFIDEIDALGRSRGKDAEASSAERDNTLNELLVALDGFKPNTGIFVVGATNRADLLDPALIRPGRIDKRIYIGNPDEKTRREIIKIHSVGKPRSEEITDDDLVELTAGFSCAQIENILNEAMLNALRNGREVFLQEDVETVFNKMLVGWQPNEHDFTQNIIDHIAIHEMGHVVVGLLSKNHAKVKKVVINLSAPTSPGYTVFDSPKSTIFTRESLFEHLMILLAGRIAEEVFFGISVTTGAMSDFEEAFRLANKMIVYYGMGEHVLYPNGSEKYKEMIDNDIIKIIEDAYEYAKFIIQNSKEFISKGADLLKTDKTISAEQLVEMLEETHKTVFPSHKYEGN
jgi:cell division protease FtsH